ncbi:MAG: hypothetical protein R2706_03535 [Acidimicrobiales bacterium]
MRAVAKLKTAQAADLTVLQAQMLKRVRNGRDDRAIDPHATKGNGIPRRTRVLETGPSGNLIVTPTIAEVLQ